MAKKSVFFRVVGCAGLYLLVFTAVASIQFTQRDGFSLQIFNLTVEGRYRPLKEGEPVPPAGLSPIMGETRILFGGLEFTLSGDSLSREGGLCLVDAAGERRFLSVEYMAVERGELRFHLAGGVQISFTAMEEGTELRIAGDFDDGAFTGLEIPYRPLKGSWIGNEGGGVLVIAADGREYRFRGDEGEDREGNRVLVLLGRGFPALYGAVQKNQGWRAEDYILAEGEAGAYREALLRWADGNYPRWGAALPGRGDEDTVIAYQGEAVGRGASRAALNAVPETFLSSPARSYESSVYLGGIGAAHRGLQAAEAARLIRITELLDQNSPAFLLESDVMEYLAVRNQESLIDRGIGLIQNMEPGYLALEQIPGLLEVRVELGRHRPDAFGGSNPHPLFDALTSQVVLLLSKCLRRLPPMEHYPIGLVLAAREGRADLGWNLRLGKALVDWGEFTGRETWAAVGRSIVLSVLSLEDKDGQVVPILNLDEGASTGERPGSISSARIYRMLGLGEYRPKALDLGPGFPGIWAWTASPEIRASREGVALDIAVSFPVGESHYLLIHGIDPFYRLQFHGMDWRTDPNFERYDSSGWVYYPQERVLALKVKHRTEVEHIILYTGSSSSAQAPSLGEEGPAAAMASPR
ncbi:MAG: hypothetical protein LBH51_07405 [Treponema sp.]|nr:hypothetical protein [Treponema sp.]